MSYPIAHRTPEDDRAEDALRQLRMAIRQAIGTLSIDHAAARAECHPNTLRRVLAGENIGVRTAARIVARLGRRLEVRVVDQANSNIL